MESEVNILAINWYQYQAHNANNSTNTKKYGEGDDKYTMGSILFDSYGNQRKNFMLEFDEHIVVRESCGVVWKNELFIYGGLRLKRQILKLDQCKLRNTGKQLPVDMGDSGCTTTEEEIWICFTHNDSEVMTGSEICLYLLISILKQFDS